MKGISELSIDRRRDDVPLGRPTTDTEILYGQSILVVLIDRNQATVARLSSFLTKTPAKATAIPSVVRFSAGIVLHGTYVTNWTDGRILIVHLSSHESHRSHQFHFFQNHGNTAFSEMSTHARPFHWLSFLSRRAATDNNLGQLLPRVSP